MEETMLKDNLHDQIEHANANQLRDLYGLITNYFNGDTAIEEWDLMPEAERDLIDKSLLQADAGLGKSLKEINANFNEL